MPRPGPYRGRGPWTDQARDTAAPVRRAHSAPLQLHERGRHAAGGQQRAGGADGRAGPRLRRGQGVAVQTRRVRQGPVDVAERAVAPDPVPQPLRHRQLPAPPDPGSGPAVLRTARPGRRTSPPRTADGHARRCTRRSGPRTRWLRTAGPAASWSCASPALPSRRSGVAAARAAAAGNPSLRELAAAPETSGRLSRSALHYALTGRQLPSEQLLAAFTAAWGAGEEATAARLAAHADPGRPRPAAVYPCYIVERAEEQRQQDEAARPWPAPRNSTGTTSRCSPGKRPHTVGWPRESTVSPTPRSTSCSRHSRRPARAEPCSPSSPHTPLTLPPQRPPTQARKGGHHELTARGARACGSAGFPGPACFWCRAAGHASPGRCPACLVQGGAAAGRHAEQQPAHGPRGQRRRVGAA